MLHGEEVVAFLATSVGMQESRPVPWVWDHGLHGACAPPSGQHPVGGTPL
jgi:hypothetical protein